MIFDSPKLQYLKTKYLNYPDQNIPFIISLDRSDQHSDEKFILERVIQKASPHQQKNWLARLCSENIADSISTWFEMMLYNWLEPIGDIDIEPEIIGNYPDFLVRTGSQQIVIEAKAFLISPSERAIHSWESTIINEIKTIQLPYLLNAKAVRLVALPNTKHFVDKVIGWLTSTPENDFTYQDRKGNIFVLESQPSPTSEYINILWPGEPIFLNPDLIKPALKEKAKDNKAIRDAGFPYVIALFIEDFLFDAEEVIAAWFGNEQWIIDVDRMEAIESMRDSRGLHWYRKELSHRSVSGTLVFKLCEKRGFQGNYLKAVFIDNPYANVRVDSSVFPVEAKFIVVDKDSKSIKMAWKSS